MVVLPEPTGKFSASFYMPWNGPGSYNEKVEKGELMQYLKEEFKEIYDAVPNFEEQVS